MKRGIFAALILSAPGFGAASPLTPEQARESFQLADGLTIELVAAEPLVASPCALAFDEKGRLFVAENRGYPRTSDPPQGTIALLEDTDADGRMDRRTVFADGLTFPNGVMPWKGGLFVTCAPDVLYLKDTDGNGRADERRLVLTGFDTKGSTQLRVNTPLLGHDGWVWLAGGLSGGRITNPAHSEFPAIELKTDLRFDPHTGRFEAVDGRSQYGHSFDEFGRRFICMNRVQVQHVVLSSTHLRRNPHLAFSDTVQNCPELVPNPLLRGGGGAARIFPISQNITTADSHAGTFSAACAVTIWKGGALPDAYRGCAFSCDPTANLVHADKLEPRGATFAAVPMFQDREFLASRDDWFRPVFLTSGPDGALYIADMYRKVIEHPDYLPEEIRKRTDFEAGKEMGRIWRVRRRDAVTAPASEIANVHEQVAALLDANSWRRETALRLIAERKEPLAAVVLREQQPLARSATQRAAIFHALHLLGQVESSDYGDALASPESALRELALRRLADDPDAAGYVLRHVPVPARDSDPAVRFVSALALGALSRREALLRVPIAHEHAATPKHVTAKDEDAQERVPPSEALAVIAVLGSADRWTRTATLSGIAGHEPAFLQAFLRALSPALTDAPGVLELLGETAQLLARATPSEERATRFAELLARHSGATFELRATLLASFAQAAQLRLPAGTQAAQVIEEARHFASAADAPTSRRLAAVQLLGRAAWEDAGSTLLSLAGAGQLREIQLAAVRSLAAFEQAEVAAALLTESRWSGYAPTLREAVLAALLEREAHLTSVLDALENRRVPANTLTAAMRARLLRHRDSPIRERAEKLFAATIESDRARAYEEAKAALALKGNGTRGREVFRNLCASCHRLDREGFAVGPDLFDIRNHPKEGILLHIVVPEHEIAPGFAAYLVELKNGRTLAGVISSETPEGLTLRQALGAEETFARIDVAKVSSSPLSLMPQGLESELSPQELADLLAYLKGEVP